ncbi:MAG: hypothetical protein GY928_31205 [Colwellia sp.]|nr:hypothetical protein [Colwellia sp.]
MYSEIIKVTTDVSSMFETPPVPEIKYFKSLDYTSTEDKNSFQLAVEDAVAHAEDTLAVVWVTSWDDIGQLPEREWYDVKSGERIEDVNHFDEDVDSVGSRWIHKAKWTEPILGDNSPIGLVLYVMLDKETDWCKLEEQFSKIHEVKPSYKFTNSLKELKL